MSLYSCHFWTIFDEIGHSASGPIIESFQDFLIKLDMKPHMHLLKISIFSPSHCQTYQPKYEQSLPKFGTILGNFQRHFLLKVGLLKCNNSNSTLAVQSGFDLHIFFQVFSKKIEKDLARAGSQTWVQLIRSRLC